MVKKVTTKYQKYFVNEWCFFLLRVSVMPKFVRVIERNKDGENLTSGVVLGPVNEGTMITLICESDEGKPVPLVEWYKDDQRLTGESFCVSSSRVNF